MDKTKEAALRALFGKPKCVADYEASITYGQSETTYRHGGQVHVESCDEMRDRWPCSAAEEFHLGAVVFMDPPTGLASARKAGGAFPVGQFVEKVGEFCYTRKARFSFGLLDAARPV